MDDDDGEADSEKEGLGPRAMSWSRRMSRTGAEEHVVAGCLVWSPESWRAAVGIAGVDVVEDELPDPPGSR